VDNWEQVKSLFAEALEQPPNERIAFLHSKCGSDSALFHEVNSLISASQESDNLIENNRIDLSRHIGERTENYADRHFGNYKILHEIGVGGMGAVFEAERDDGEFTKHVALKIVRQSIADSEIIARFKRERQILATLNHPNIASLYDGGVSENGEPFIAMEFVDGVNLTEYAQKSVLSVEQKLRIFLKICGAVAYAHRNLVVHRDIKPANILITKTGEPKLLDFGLAKAFESDTSNTGTALRAFTPAYASPEQINGDTITTSSDIYSLGVVLYELLTEAKPLNIENGSYDEIVMTINVVTPVKPSQSSSNGEHATSRHALRGDLDNIVLTTLRKQPERRYKTVEDLSDDIDRHLTGRPIAARPNTVPYLAGKFIRRNKVVVTAAAVVLISLIGGLIFSMRQAENAKQERDRAQKRFQDVRQLSNALLFEITPKIERLPGSLEAREMLVNNGLKYLDSLAGEAQTDPGLQTELASAYEKIANLQGNLDRPNLNDFTGAISSFEKARLIRTEITGDTENQFRLAENYRVASSIRNRQNDVKGAIADAEKAKVLFADLVRNNAETSAYQIAAIEAKLDEGAIYSLNNQYAVAIPLFRQALEMISELDQQERTTRYLNSRSLTALANALSWDGQQSEAESEMARALAINEKLQAEFPLDSEIQAGVLMTYNLASSTFEGVDNKRALALAKLATATSERATNADPADSQAIFNLARAYSRLGISYTNVDQRKDAEKMLQKAEELLKRLISSEPKNVLYLRDLAKLSVRRGDTDEKGRLFHDALTEYQNSATIFEQIASYDSLNTLAQRDLAQSLKSIGLMQIRLNSRIEGKKTLLRAKEILDRLQTANALGKFDQQLIDDVERGLRSI